MVGCVKGDRNSDKSRGLTPQATGGTLITGWTELRLDCVLVTDSTNTVADGGITGLLSPAPESPTATPG